ncbi:UDP-glucose 4-epimerase GalE [Candidatus Ozemobacteraceae bacterium]|nr:UDP-glucose 4-epimerase GalE [Candidatus Ozemobacteraceae bacterium]
MEAQTAEKRVLVVGGAGYIGAHTCKILKLRGFTPIVFDSLVTGYEENVRWGPFVRGDLADRAAIDRAIGEYAPSAVIHFAAFSLVGESMTDPGKYYRNNVVGSLNLLEAMRDSGVKDLVFSSTCATYGVPRTIPIPEMHEQRPINPYGSSKMMMERMMGDFAQAHGLRFVALRYFNAAGGDPDAEIGERHEPESHLIPLVLDAARGKRAHVTVFGDDYETPDGTCIRDYIHVNDLADAHLRALDYLRRGGTVNVFNLGNGKGYSILEVIRVAERVTGLNIPSVIGARRPGDPPVLVGDAGLARRDLGWNPEYADLEAIVAHAWAFRRRLA